MRYIDRLFTYLLTYSKIGVTLKSDLEIVQGHCYYSKAAGLRVARFPIASKQLWSYY